MTWDRPPSCPLPPRAHVTGGSPAAETASTLSTLRGCRRPGAVPDPRPRREVPRLVRPDPRRLRHQGCPQRYPRPAHELDHGAVGADLPSRTPGSHPHLERASPPPRPARIRNPSQRPPSPPGHETGSSTPPSAPTHHRSQRNRPSRHTPTRPTRRHPPRVPTCHLTSTGEIFGRRSVPPRRLVQQAGGEALEPQRHLQVGLDVSRTRRRWVRPVPGGWARRRFVAAIRDIACMPPTLSVWLATVTQTAGSTGQRHTPTSTSVRPHTSSGWPDARSHTQGGIPEPPVPHTDRAPLVG